MSQSLKFDPKVAHRSAIEILTRFQIVFKIAKIYESNNLIFLHQIKILYNMIQVALKREAEAFFKLRQGTLFFNRVRLKFGFSNYHLFKFIVGEFREKEIGTIAFAPDLSEDELKQFMFLLAKVEKVSEAPFEDLLRVLSENKIVHISLEKISPFEIPSKERDTAKVYLLGMLHLKEHFEKEKQEKIKINTTRRLMQALYNHIVENEYFVYGLTNLKNYDEYTLNHSMNVCTLSIALGRHLGLDRNELVDLGISAFFHDFGKLETPLEVLNKPSQLTPEEREVIERHPHQGAEKLIQGKEFQTLPLRALNVALEHHLKADATGYPKAYKRKNTNLFSRIVKIIDYFDAITTPRVYRKKSFSRLEALAHMAEKSGTEFDPVIFKVFSNMMGAFPVGTLVALNTGEIGIVFEINPEASFALRPSVKLITDRDGNKVDGQIADLTEVDPRTGRYLRIILKALDPEEYNIKISDYFLAQAQ